MLKTKTTVQEVPWNLNLRTKVGDTVTHDFNTWVNTTGKNSEPGTGTDWELFTISESSLDTKFDKTGGTITGDTTLEGDLIFDDANKIDFKEGAQIYGRIQTTSEGLDLNTVANRNMIFKKQNTESFRIDTNNVVQFISEIISANNITANQLLSVADATLDDHLPKLSQVVALILGAIDGGKGYESLADAHAVNPLPSDGVIFQAVNPLDPSEDGYHIYKSTAPNGFSIPFRGFESLGDLAFDESQKAVAGSVVWRTFFDLKYNIFQKDAAFGTNTPDLIELRLRSGVLDLKHINHANGNPDNYYAIREFQIDTVNDFYQIEIGYSTTPSGFVTSIASRLEINGPVSGIEEIDLVEIFSSGYSGKIRIDWDAFKSYGDIDYNYNPNFPTWDKTGFRRDREYYTYEFRDVVSELANELKQGEGYVLKSGDELFIRYYYSKDKDIVYTFKRRMVNNLMTFGECGLIPRNKFLLDKDFTIDEVLVAGAGDNIGPIGIDGATYLVGGNHTSPAPDNFLTAEHTGYTFYVDGNPLSENDIFIAAKEVQVIADINIFDPRTLSASVQDVLIEEKVYYRISKGNIEVVLQHHHLIDNIPETYYGMQLVNGFWQEKIYFAHSDNTSLQNFATSLNSGDISGVNNDPEKVITSNTGKNICCAMYLDPDKGLAVDRDIKLLDPTSGVFFTANSTPKTYARLIQQSNAGTYLAGTKVFWYGVYTFFDHTEISSNDPNILYHYFMKYQGLEYLVIDVSGAVDDYIYHPSIVGKQLTVKDKDNTITSLDVIDNLFVGPEGLKLVSTGYGNVYLQIY